MDDDNYGALGNGPNWDNADIDLVIDIDIKIGINIDIDICNDVVINVYF